MTARSKALSAAIRHGDQQVDSGARVDCVAELLAEITRSAIVAMHGSHVIDRDVLPPTATNPPAVDVFSRRGSPAEE